MPEGTNDESKSQVSFMIHHPYTPTIEKGQCCIDIVVVVVDKEIKIETITNKAFSKYLLVSLDLLTFHQW